MGLSFDQASPDHYTFSRFRSRLSYDTMCVINHEFLSQFAAKGMTINEVIAVGARLVQSASHPISKEKLEEEKKKRETPERKLDKWDSKLPLDIEKNILLYFPDNKDVLISINLNQERMH